MTRRFGARLALEGLDLEVRAGTKLGLLGPNGAGKSTTLGLLTGRLRPSAGSVRVAGGSPCDPAVRSRLGLAPQELALYPELSAEENLRFFGHLYGLGGARLEERVRTCLELAGLSDRRRDRVSAFSGGMQRRLNLAVAVVHDPQVVFLDEPTVGVDPHSRNHLLEALEGLARQGMTVVYSTHYMEEVTRIADEVAILDHGRLLARGTVQELVARHGGAARVRFRAGGVERDEPCDDPWRRVHALLEEGRSVEALHVEQPDLESVFLSLTGRSLRD